jgi:ferritin-like metal-binding protein YciE
VDNHRRSPIVDSGLLIEEDDPDSKEGDGMATDTRGTQQTIADWLGDIVALESHVEEAMDRQLSLVSNSTNVATSFKRYHDTVRDSKHKAEAYQKSYGSTSGNPVIKAGSNLLGKAAGMIDKMRDDSASKALRDDYTAYNHLAIAYTMLHTTALALNDPATAEFSKSGLTTYARLVQDINQIIADAVIADLAANDKEASPNTNVLQEARKTINDAWKATANA